MTAPADRIAEHLNLCFGPEFAPADSFSLAGMERALKKLERPQDRLPPTIHVAGTNGKGSTCAFMRAIAEAAGLSVHCFSKPHLHQTRERVRLAGKLVSDDEFIGAIDRVAATGERLRHFEGQVAAAFTLFADTPADLLILETGMGGTHDATNVIERPALCVLTPVDIDHAALLGPTRAAIARQKAGVLKVGARVIVADHLPAGFEIDNPRLVSSGDAGALAWIEDAQEPVSAEFRDDRFSAAFERRSEDQSVFTVAYVVRAVSPGRYVHPQAYVEDMYRPDRFGRTATGTVEVTAAR